MVVSHLHFVFISHLYFTDFFFTSSFTSFVLTCFGWQCDVGVHSTVGEHKLKKKLKNCMGKEYSVQFSVNQ